MSGIIPAIINSLLDIYTTIVVIEETWSGLVASKRMFWNKLLAISHTNVRQMFAHWFLSAISNKHRKYYLNELYRYLDVI